MAHLSGDAQGLCWCQCAHCTYTVCRASPSCAHQSCALCLESCVHPSLPIPSCPQHAHTGRFRFTSPTPCIIHEAWVCFTHPPLEPPADKSRRRGEPLALDLKGVALADGDSGGPGLVAAAQLTARLEAKTRDAQVCVRMSARGGGVAGVFGRWSGGCSMLAVTVQQVVARCSAVSLMSGQTPVCDT